MTTRRYVKPDPGAFWEVELEGTTMTTTAGAGGAEHRAVRKTTKKGFERACREKLEEGYALVPRYELATKFWQAERLGRVVVIRYGRIGARPRIKRTTHRDAEAARTDLEKRIEKKLAAGYSATQAHERRRVSRA